MAEFLDQLARALATPMPRREALKLVGKSILLALLPIATRSTAQSDPCASYPGTFACPRAPSGTVQQEIDCCPTGTTCCCGKIINSLNEPIWECVCCGLDFSTRCTACLPGKVCGKGGPGMNPGGPWCFESCAAAGGIACGTACCGTGERPWADICVNATLGLCCTREQAGCGETCCGGNEHCCPGNGGESGMCCEVQSGCCGDSYCCPRGQICCNPKALLKARRCCDPKRNQTCVRDAKNPFIGVCCPDQQVCRTRHWTYCCTPTERCVNGRCLKLPQPQ